VGYTGGGCVSGRFESAADRHLYETGDGDLLPDFGRVGYRLGERPIPHVQTVLRVRPVKGDNTAHLQRAIDTVAARPLVAGARGALQLLPGIYEVGGTLTLTRSGVVIRGAGDGEDPSSNTIVRAVGRASSRGDVLVVGAGGSWVGMLDRRLTEVTSRDVPMGASELSVADPSRVRAGDLVVITHPCTRAWLEAIGGGGTGADRPWAPGSTPIQYLRRIVCIESDVLTLDAPLFYRLDRSLSRSRLHVWDKRGLIGEVGVEGLRIDIAAQDPENEDHAKNGIVLRNVVNSWVRDCTVLNFAKAGVMSVGATRTTVANCRALSPAAPVERGRRYNFDAEERSQLVLFTSCHATAGRHSFIVNGGSSASGIVFHRTTSTGSLASSEGHRAWSQGLLFDNHTELAPVTSRAILLGNRGDYGTGHGWGAVNSVAWATRTSGARVVVQRPPTAQNYAIGCTGPVDGDGPFEQPTGWIEDTGRSDLWPASLYEAQRGAL